MKAILRSRLWIYAAVVPMCAVLIFPIYWLFNTAISSPDQLRQLPPSFWPDAPRWEVFATVLRERGIFAPLEPLTEPRLRCRWAFSVCEHLSVF